MDGPVGIWMCENIIGKYRRSHDRYLSPLSLVLEGLLLNCPSSAFLLVQSALPKAVGSAASHCSRWVHHRGTPSYRRQWAGLLGTLVVETRWRIESRERYFQDLFLDQRKRKNPILSWCFKCTWWLKPDPSISDCVTCEKEGEYGILMARIPGASKYF